MGGPRRIYDQKQQWNVLKSEEWNPQVTVETSMAKPTLITDGWVGI